MVSVSSQIRSDIIRRTACTTAVIILARLFEHREATPASSGCRTFHTGFLRAFLLLLHGVIVALPSDTRSVATSGSHLNMFSAVLKEYSSEEDVEQYEEDVDY